MSKTGVAKRIREALEHGPMTTAELRVCLDLSRGEANTAINDMLRAKSPLVGHDGGLPGERRYMLVREPAKPMTPEEAEARRRELARGHAAATRRRKGMRTWVEYVADSRKAATAEQLAKRAAKAAERDQRRAAKAGEREAARIERERKAVAARTARAVARPMKAVYHAEPSLQEAPRLMSSDEWLALGGKIERIPAHWETAA